jgi:hypothetical protein
VAGGFGPEVALVLPLDLGHVDEVFDEARMTRLDGVPGGPLVLPDVVALEAAGAVHRHAAAVTQAGERRVRRR